MRWDERQVRLLAEMGLRQWAPPQQRDSGAPGTAPGAIGQRGAVRPSLGPDASPSGALGAREADGTRLEVPSRVTAVAARSGGSDAAAALDERPAAPVGEHRAPPSPVEALDWPALREAVGACTACGLCRSRRKPVFGTGHARAHLMVVGEAPGEQEDHQGEPFVGKAGQLLDNMLQALGLGRGAGGAAEPGEGAQEDPARCAYIANVLKCRPPLNRNPLPEEVAQCEPFLRRQVALVRPRVILAMGRFAVQSLLRSDAAVGKLRGRVHAFEGVPLVVTYHPAYLLRNPADKARAWDDLCLARAALREAGSPDPGA